MQPLPPLSEASGFQAPTKKGLSLRTFQELSPELAKELSDFDRDKDGTIDTHELLDIVREHKRREAELKNRAKRLTILSITVCVVSCIALAVLFGVVYGANEASKETKVGSSGSAKLSSNPRANLMVNKDTGEPVTVQNSEQTVRMSRKAPLVGRFASLENSMTPMERRFWAKKGIVFTDQSRGLTSLQSEETSGESAEAPVVEEDPSQGVQVECPPNVVARYDTTVPICFLRYFDLGLTRDEALRLYNQAQSDPTITAALTVNGSPARRFAAAQGEGTESTSNETSDEEADIVQFNLQSIGNGALVADASSQGTILVPAQPIADDGPSTASRVRSRHAKESNDEENSGEVEVMMSLFVNGAVPEEKARFSSLQSSSSFVATIFGSVVCKEGCGYIGTAPSGGVPNCGRCPAGQFGPIAPNSFKQGLCAPIPAGYVGLARVVNGEAYPWLAVLCPRDTFNDLPGQSIDVSNATPIFFGKILTNISSSRNGRTSWNIPYSAYLQKCKPCTQKPCDPRTGLPGSVPSSVTPFITPTFV